ncbi:DVU3141 family protein [Thiorhodococcus drewsii]|nr:DVU3141 family protein [Thiorhodococcus drewsii]
MSVFEHGNQSLLVHVGLLGTRVLLRSVFARVSLCFCVALLSGCAHWPPSWTRDLSGGTNAAETLSFQELLTREPANTLVVLPSSPWGTNIRVLLHETYAAASGRNCRQLTIDPDANATPALACQDPDDPTVWVPVRLLQIGGRPLLSVGDEATPVWSGSR